MNGKKINKIKNKIQKFNFLSEVSHTIKIQDFDHQSWSDFSV